MPVGKLPKAFQSKAPKGGLRSIRPPKLRNLDVKSLGLKTSKLKQF